MNFLRNRSLRQLGIYALLLIVAVFTLQFIGIRRSIQSLEEAERKIDFARTIQIRSQQLALQTQRFLNGNKDLGSDIVAKLEHQNHSLDILANGGRLEGTKSFLKPLSRLPKITFNNLRENWMTYKSSVEEILTKVQSNNDAGVFEKTKLMHEARWISMSDWFNKLIADLEDEVEGKQQAILNWFIFFVIVDLIITILFLLALHKLVIRPLKELETNILHHKHTSDFNNNEIGKITTGINDIINNLKDATDFVTSIGDGKLDLDYKQELDLQYEPGKNKLADSLIQMQGKLKTMNEEERKRQWANEGITKFVEIMRSSNDNLMSLGDAVISALVQYTRSNQGAIYILNDEDPQNKHLELVSLFAFDAKKYEKQKIKLGEGILGQTFLEKETTYLTDVPDEYIRITSGLGNANPKSILLFPLKVDKDAYGIIELASFYEYQPHEITFVEKLGESIAATLASVRAAEKNRQLIEQFQQQTEEMRAQEEEMRQNMEELQATQEEVVRKEQAYLKRIKELENQDKNPASAQELEKVREQATKNEHELKLKIEDLSRQLAEKPAHSDDWAVAEEVEKALKLNLEAIKITQEELSRKAGE
jgi:GAF domain-containing protein